MTALADATRAGDRDERSPRGAGPAAGRPGPPRASTRAGTVPALRAVLLVAPLLSAIAAAAGPGALILTGPPPSDAAVQVVTACHAIVTINANGVPVSGQPVCATAESRANFDCAPDAPGYVRCTLAFKLTGGGHSPLHLPGAFEWDIGTVDITRCIPGPAGRPQCAAYLALYPDTAAWSGLVVLGPSGASSTQTFSRDIVMPLNELIPPCFVLSGAGVLTVKAEVALGPLSVAQAQATAGTAMTKEFCD